MSSFGNQQQWGQPQQQPSPQQGQAPQQGHPYPPQQPYGQRPYPQQPHPQAQQQWGGPQQAPQHPQQHSQQWPGPQDHQAPWGLTAASPSDAVRRDARSAAVKQMAIGGVVALVGIAVTVGTYAAASDDGGHYFVAYGPAIIGLITFVKGLVGYLKA